jgi:hypothetical protein
MPGELRPPNLGRIEEDLIDTGGRAALTNSRL